MEPTYYEGRNVSVEEQKFNGETIVRETNTPSPVPQQAEQVRLHPGYAGQGQLREGQGYSGYVNRNRMGGYGEGEYYGGGR